MRNQAAALLLLLTIILGLPIVYSSEPGTGFATAGELEEGVYTFRMEVGGIHFFKVWLETGETIYVVMNPPINQDFDVFLLTPDRRLLEQSVAPTGVSERVSALAPQSGYYYVVVTSFGGSEGLYVLNIRVIKPKVMTETETITQTSVKMTVIYKPSIIYSTVTEASYVTVTEVRRVEVERLPWTFMGLVSLGAMILAGFAILSSSIRRKTKPEPPPQPDSE